MNIELIGVLSGVVLSAIYLAVLVVWLLRVPIRRAWSGLCRLTRYYTD